MWRRFAERAVAFARRGAGRVAASARLPGRVAAFVRWLVSTEELPVATDQEPAETSSAPRFSTWLVAGEELAQSLGGVAQPVRRPGFVQRILSRELLPDLQAEPRTTSERTPALGPGSVEDPPLPKPRGGIPKQTRPRRTFVSWLLSVEECPHSKSTPTGRGEGFVRMVVVSELCPTTGGQARQRRSGFLRWLLTPEEL